MTEPYEVVKKKIVKDFLFKSLSKEQISNKYGVSTASVARYASKDNFVLRLEPPEKLLIKVAEKDYLLAMKILRANEIVTHEVAPRFELLEYYESSIK